MDPLAHALLGAAAAQLLPQAPHARTRTALLGAWGGIAADLDLLISSQMNPLSHIVYHRQFSHSLLFIPFGALLLLIPLLLFPALRARWRTTGIALLVGYAGHGLLDCFTSYGTLLFWPFSFQRIAWDAIAEVDLVPWIILSIGVFLAWSHKRKRPAAIALLLFGLYLGFGLFTHHRALLAQREVAASRGHTELRGRVFPTLSNLWLWHSVYEHEGTLYLDDIYTPYFGRAFAKPLGAVDRFDDRDLALSLPITSALADQFALFSTFADDYLARQSEDPLVIGDLRYLAPRSTRPIWAIKIFPTAIYAPVTWTETPLELGGYWKQFWDSFQVAFGEGQ